MLACNFFIFYKLMTKINFPFYIHCCNRFQSGLYPLPNK